MRRHLKKIKAYTTQKETIVFGLGLIPKEGIPEIKIRYNRSSKVFLGKITHSKDSYEFLKKIFDKNTIQLQESFVVLYLNRANQILGYYKHSVGGIAGTVADPRIIFATGVASASSGIILSHNHPSGNLTPSQADIDLTRKIKEGGRLLEIQLLDHLIVTKAGYYSFADEGLI
ncbi:MAG: JAB domain-containing protein [Bacteroidota bacterium]